MTRIFISYRRDDSGGWAGRLYDRLSQRFGRDNVFMDIDTIESGLDFVEVIEQAVGSCDALIAVIGRQWLTITDDAGRRRLDNPEDFVRLEIAAALARNIRVIPALIEGARMPRSTELPDGLQLLARRNAHDVSDRRFHYDVDRLIEVLDKVLGAAKPATDEKSDMAITHEPVIAPQPRQESSTPRHPFEPEMILIPAGEFLMGSDPQKDPDADRNEQPQHSLHLPNYYLAKTPVTNAQYLAFVQETHDKPPKHWIEGKPPRGKEDHPVVEVSWYDAIEYCRWLSRVTGKSYNLPSEAEWEKGARGTDGRIYPWGDRWDTNQCNSKEGGQEATTPVEAYLPGASPDGVLDMAGNVLEWTRSLWGRDMSSPNFRYPYNSEDGRENLHAPENASRVARGNSFGGIRSDMRCAARYWMMPNWKAHYYGFRMVIRL